MKKVIAAILVIALCATSMPAYALAPESRFAPHSAEMQSNGFSIRLTKMLVVWAGLGCLIAASHPFVGAQVTDGFYYFKQTYPIWADTTAAVFFTAISDIQGQYLSDSPKKSFYQTLFVSVFAGILFGWQFFFGYSWIENAFETSFARGIATSSIRLSLSLQVAALIWIYKNKIQKLGADYKGYSQVKKKVDIDVITRPLYFLSDWYIQAWIPFWLKPWATMLVTFVVRPFSMWAQNQRKPFLNVVDRVSALSAKRLLPWLLPIMAPLLMGASGGSAVLGIGTVVATLAMAPIIVTAGLTSKKTLSRKDYIAAFNKVTEWRSRNDVIEQVADILKLETSELWAAVKKLALMATERSIHFKLEQGDPYEHPLRLLKRKALKEAFRDAKSFAEQLRLMRVSRLITTAELSSQLGLGMLGNKINKWEHGVGEPDKDELQQFSSFFGVKPSDWRLNGARVKPVNGAGNSGERALVAGHTKAEYVQALLDADWSDGGPAVAAAREMGAKWTAPDRAIKVWNLKQHPKLKKKFAWWEEKGREAAKQAGREKGSRKGNGFSSDDKLEAEDEAAFRMRVNSIARRSI